MWTCDCEKKNYGENYQKVEISHIFPFFRDIVVDSFDNFDQNIGFKNI